MNMTSKTIENPRKVGGYNFELLYSRRSIITLDFYLEQFNEKDYYIFKSTNKFREVDYEDLLEFKYSGYILYKKEIYNKKYIDLWIKFSNGLYIPFLSKTFPPFKPTKIIIKK
jgi:hypothetical protein